MKHDELFMEEAIRLSEMAIEHGNEPFGAVLVKDGDIVFTNENQIYVKSDPTFHAEEGLLREFFKERQITDLHDYTMYSSCEPCFMCSGAMVWAQLGRLVYAASDIDLCHILGEKGSNCSGIVFDHSHHKPSVTSGVLRDKSLRVLTKYFQNNQKG